MRPVGEGTYGPNGEHTLQMGGFPAHEETTPKPRWVIPVKHLPVNENNDTVLVVKLEFEAL